MSKKTPPSATLDKRIPTPLVLAIASAMICVGVAAYWASRQPDTPLDAPTSRVLVDDSTPERAAESFLDAWRKREHDVAAALAIGEAKAAVEARRAADLALSKEERAIKRQLWDAMASTRLSLVPTLSTELDDAHVALETVARGRFLGKPYERAIDFDVEKSDDRWRVARMELGPHLTDQADVLAVPRTPASPTAPDPDAPNSEAPTRDHEAPAAEQGSDAP